MCIRDSGLACAAALVADGWRVVYTGRRAEALAAAIARAGDPCGDIAERAVAIPCDVGDEHSVAALFAGIHQRFGRLDLLFNNAGTGLAATTPDAVSGDDWRRAVDVNLNGAFYCLSQAFRLMKEQQPMGGRIINNGSISAHAPRPGSIAYTATKHAISGLTKTAALDGRPFDIAVGQIDFIFVDWAAAQPFLKSGKLKLIAVQSDQRSALLPDLPPVGETVPGYNFTVWGGLIAPAGVPPAIVNTLNSAATQGLAPPPHREDALAAAAPRAPCPGRHTVCSSSQRVRLHRRAPHHRAPAPSSSARARPPSVLPLRQEHWTVDEARQHFVARGWDAPARLLTTHRTATVPLVAYGQVYALSPGPLPPHTTDLPIRRHPPDAEAATRAPSHPRSCRPGPAPCIRRWRPVRWLPCRSAHRR